jgi:hypothetical protein
MSPGGCQTPKLTLHRINPPDTESFGLGPQTLRSVLPHHPFWHLPGHICPKSLLPALSDKEDRQRLESTSSVELLIELLCGAVEVISPSRFLRIWIWEIRSLGSWVEVSAVRFWARSELPSVPPHLTQAAALEIGLFDSLKGNHIPARLCATQYSGNRVVERPHS